MRLVADIETDGLIHELTKIHCIGIIDIEKAAEYLFEENQIMEGLAMLQDAEYVVMHNGVKFDLPALKKIHPWFSCDVKDTLIYASVIFPNLKEIDIIKKNGLKGSNSLEAWGKRLDCFKGEFGQQTDWKTYTKEMGKYCLQDCRVTLKLWIKLNTKYISEEAISLEHDFAHIIAKQERSGFYFDTDKARRLVETLYKKEKETLEELQNLFPPTKVKMNSKYYIGSKCGEEKIYDTKKNATADGAVDIKDGPYKYKEIKFNPNSTAQIEAKLVSKYGWKSEEFTEKGNPKITEEVLGKLEYAEAKKITEYKTIKKRLTAIIEGKKPWLGCVRNNRIHGSLKTCGALTGRTIHHDPNMGQVVSVDKIYGKECRELWIVPKRYKLLGVDASGLEARGLAHVLGFFDGGAYAKVVLEGDKEKGTDTHTINANILGLSRRDAKTFFYALIYGASDKKLGAIAKKDEKYGRKMRESLLSSIKGFKNLTETVKIQLKKKGSLYGLDKRILKPRGEHSALNTLIQNVGAVVMKKALIIFDKKMEDKGYRYDIDYWYCVNVHDEFQTAVKEELDLDSIGKMAVESIKEAGEYYDLNCPLDGEYKIGRNWAETH